MKIRKLNYMIISPKRVKFIRDNFFEFSFVDEDSDEEVIPDFEAFQTLSSAEQYFLATEYNWDDGTVVLNWIIDSQICDKGTAIMIFWMADPDYYFDYTEEIIDDWAKDVWKLLQKIIKKIYNGEFTKSTYGFNPTKNGYKTEWESAIGIWKLPNDLKNGNKGMKPIAIG